MKNWCWLIPVLACLATTASARKRTYYIAATQINWNYNPTPSVISGRWGGTTYRKIVYREYTDGYFITQDRRSTRLGFFGPTLVAEVGDTIVVRFKNLAQVPCNIVAQGVQFNSENSLTAVQPGEQIIYQWSVTHVSSPTYDDPSCVNKLYYSNVSPELDLNSGLIGTLIVCKIGWIANVDSDHHPPFVAYFAITDESKTHFSRNLTYQAAANGSHEKNVHYHINGFSNGTLHVTSECLQNMDTWYLAGVSPKPTAFSVFLENHSIHIRSSHVTNLVTLTSGSTEVIEVEENRNAKGSWRFYSKMEEHYLNGMIGVVHARSCGNQFGGRVFGNWWNRARRRHRNDGPRDERQRPDSPTLKIRSYYISSEEILWDYGPYRYNLFTGDKLNDPYYQSSVFYKSGPYRVGAVYMKVQYFAYTDETFTTKVNQTAGRGFLGPVLKMERDEILRVVFRNNATRPYNVFVDGIFNNDTSPVAPGNQTTYEFKFEPGEQEGPSLNDEQCTTRTYYSTVEPIRDVESGLIGPLLICKSGTLDEYNNQIGIDQEIFLHFSTANENLSWYIGHTINATTINSGDISYRDTSTFQESNKMTAINGLAYGNLLGIEAEVGDRVSLHVTCAGSSKDLHTITIENQTFYNGFAALDYGLEEIVSTEESHFRSFEVSPFASKTLYFKPLVRGKWEISTLNDRAREDGTKVYLLVKRRNGNHSTNGISHHRNSYAFPINYASPAGRTRWYYIAAVEQLWDYSRGASSTGEYTGNNTIYEKVIYEEYTDASFTKRKDKDPRLGLLGPVIQAEVGDTIKVVFHNQGCRPFSMHPQMLEFHANDSGDWVLAGNNIRTNFRGPDTEFINRGSVSTGHSYTYTWFVPQSATHPTNANPSECTASFYYSNVDRARDVESGLIGPLLLCNPGIIGPQDDNTIRYDVDREFHVLLKEFDEEKSWYVDANKEGGHWNFNGSNVFPAINGLFHGELDGLDMEPGERIAWHVFSMDSLPRSIYFEGDSVLVYRSTANVASSYVETISKVSVNPILPGSSTTLTMVPISTGAWKFGDFAASSRVRGMYGQYRVRPKECGNPLGLESGLISNRQMTSSSVYVTRARFGREVGKWKASYARLNKKGHINAWIPNRSDKSPWIQVDLGTPMRVTGIILQGTSDGHKRMYVKEFKVLHSIDNRHWAFYNRQGSDFNMLFQGNFFYNVAVTRNFSPHLLTRYIRVMPISWQNRPAVRMELLGCSLEGRCEEPQGVSSGKIPDSAMNASSEFLYKRTIRWAAKYGRLNYEPKEARAENDLPRLDEDSPRNRDDDDYDDDDDNDDYDDDDDDDDRNHRHRGEGNRRFPYFNRRGGRFGNRRNRYGHDRDRNDNDRDRHENRGRHGRDRDYAPAWGPTKNNRRQWIQVDLGRIIRVSGIVTQGVIYKRSQLFVKSFILRFSLNGVNWNVYQDPVSNQAKIFRGNIEPLNPVTHLLQITTLARYVRIQPWTWRGRIALRFEILGCPVVIDESTYKKVTPMPEDCVALD